VRWALEKGTTVLSVTNVMGSTLTRLSRVYVGQNSGPEIGVAATKTFTAQLMVLSKLAIVLGSKKGVLTSTKVEELLDDLRRVPSLVEETIKSTESTIKSLAWKLKDAHSFCFLGRGVNSVTAMEGRLKLLELSYIPSLAYPAGESKHGFIAVVEKGYPVVFIAPRDRTYTKLIGNLMEMKARGAFTIAIVEEDDTEVTELVDEVIKIPIGTVEMTTPMVYIIPLQLFALYMAEANNLDPDKPRNLAKSVTVE
jgi:glucosamine--fructose-6-phosphate aminotransferase (isomerizing)